MDVNIKPDLDREKRCGAPEVVFGEGKSIEDLLNIANKFLDSSGRVIISRIDLKRANAILDSLKPGDFNTDYNEKGRVLVIKRKDFRTETRRLGKIGILAAGTSDIPVAEESRVIAEELGCEVIREYDVGIAGIHRVFTALEKIKGVEVIIVIAGMEGALPSVVSGLVDVPVIGVPTSVGYGTGRNGKAAILTMLNSCSPLAVMNIDNGYGAAILAYRIVRGRN